MPPDRLAPKEIVLYYYSFHIGDYRKDTAHLTPIEHYIYRTLLDNYYLDELPIKNDTHVILRRLSLDYALEYNLLNVLKDFFTLEENLWIHKRVELELMTYRKMSEGGKKGAAIRWHKGSDNPPIAPLSNPNANHKPITNNQEPNINTIAASDKSLSQKKHKIEFNFDTGEFTNLNGEIKLWGKAYPAVSIDTEIHKAGAWLVANPSNRKSNYSRFLTNWLSRAQDKAPSHNMPARDEQAERRNKFLKDLKGGSNGTNNKIIDITPYGTEAGLPKGF